MSFIGNKPATNFQSIRKQSITGTGATAYALDHPVSGPNDIEVFVNNIRQEPVTAYNATSQTITFSEAITSADSAYMIYQAQTMGTIAHPADQPLSATAVSATAGTFSDSITVTTLKGATTGVNANKILLPTSQQIIATEQAAFVSPKSIIQYEHRLPNNTGFSTTSTSMVDVTNFYVDITPKYTNSLLIFECTHDSKVTVAAGYARYRVVDSNNSDTVVHSNTYIGQSSYHANYLEWLTTSLRTVFVSSTTSTMRLQLQVQVNSGGTFEMNWSSGDQRVVQVTEIAQ